LAWIHGLAPGGGRFARGNPNDRFLRRFCAGRRLLRNRLQDWDAAEQAVSPPSWCASTLGVPPDEQRSQNRYLDPLPTGRAPADDALSDPSWSLSNSLVQKDLGASIGERSVCDGAMEAARALMAAELRGWQRVP